MPTIPVDSLAAAADPRLAPYTSMRDAELAQRERPHDPSAHAGLFIAEGELVVRRLLASRYPLHSILTTPTRLDTLRDVLPAIHPDVPIFLAPPDLLSSLVGFNMHRGLLAIGRRSLVTTPADVIARPGPLIVLEDLTNHDNLGGIFRNLAALGGTGSGVLLSPRCADPLYRKSLRVSMGAILSIPFASAEPAHWPSLLTTLANAGWQTWAMTPRSGAYDIRDLAKHTKRSDRVALVLGSEGPGLTDSAIQSCTHQVQIPMFKSDDSIDSLNVGMAAGIGLFALAARQ